MFEPTVTEKTIHGASLAYGKPDPIPQSPRAVVKGTVGGHPSAFALTDAMLSRHFLAVGGTGTGKTNLMYHIVSQLRDSMLGTDSMVVFDSKGDFLERFQRPGDIVVGRSCGNGATGTAYAKWGLSMEVLADGAASVPANAFEISSSLFSERIRRNSSNPFFPNAAKDLFAALLICLMRAGLSPSNRDFSEALSSMTADEMRALLDDHPDLASIGSYIAKGSAAQANGVIAEMHSVAREVLSGPFSSPAADFSMRSFIRSPAGKACFIEYDLSAGEVLAPVYSLLIDLALKEALGRSGGKGRLWVIADEMRLLPNLTHLEDAINFGRSAGVSVIAGLQTIDQLESSYADAAKARNAVAGFSSVAAFSSHDPATRKAIRDRFGESMVMISHQQKDGKFASEVTRGHVVEDWDLIALDVGEAVIGLPESRPFKMKIDLYR
jgi:hypothetical protein